MNSSTCHDDTEPFPEPVDEYNRYRVSVVTYEVNPAMERYKHMLHLVAYDIRHPNRLRKVARTCLDFGVRIEYSVFECDLDEPRFARMWERLSAIIDHDEDAVVAYKICGSCVPRIASAGSVVRPVKPLVYTF